MPLVSKTQQAASCLKLVELIILCSSIKARLKYAQSTQLQLTDAIVGQAL